MIPIIKPVLGEEELAAVRRPLASGWVTQGPEVAAFEAEFARRVGAPHACAVSSCTAALHLALRAVGVGPGDEVATPSHSFVATANAVRYCGAVPVFVDVDPATYNLAPEALEAAIGPRTRAVLAVHQMGMPCDLPRLLEITRRHGLPLVEDAACAVGSDLLVDGAWRPIGRPEGEVACFSFHPRKLVTMGDGGMLTTRDAALDARFRLWRQHGMSVPDRARHASPRVIFESYEELGYNYRLTDIQAAIGRVQLERLAGIVERRRALAERYHALLAAAGLEAPAEPSWARSNWQSYCVRLPPGSDQRVVMQRLLDAGISTRRGIQCAHREPAYRAEPWRCGPGGCPSECAPGTCDRLHHSEAAQDGCLILPLHHELTGDDQRRIVTELAAAVGEHLERRAT